MEINKNDIMNGMLANFFFWVLVNLPKIMKWVLKKIKNMSKNEETTEGEATQGDAADDAENV